MSDELIIGGQRIRPGARQKLEIPVADLYTGSAVTMPVYVARGKKPGPVMFVSAAVHGDELNGIEIIRRLIAQKTPKLASGTLIAVPMVNVYGVLNQSRYLPDRRDLNRCFPGSARGSLAGRVAHVFLTEIVSKCDYGIDLHTGAIHRSNLPQIRANLTDPETRDLADAFGVPVLLNADLRDGSLRESAVSMGAKILLYEAGQALRFDELSIKAGLRGVLNVMTKLGMTNARAKSKRKTPIEPFVATASAWVRADESGFVRDRKKLGDRVEAGEVLAEIGNPFGEMLCHVVAVKSGIIIGKQNIPLVQEGDAMFHIAYFKGDEEGVVEHIETMQEVLNDDALNSRASESA